MSLQYNMKHTHCTTCGKEKTTRAQQRSMFCISCSLKGKTLSDAHKKSISDKQTGSKRGLSPLKGRTLSIEHRNAVSIGLGGDGNPTARKRSALSRWTRLVKERDGKCMTCESTERLEAHHILAKAMYPQFATMTINGITLCYDCHRGTRGVH